MNSNTIVDLKSIEQRNFVFLQIAYDLDMIYSLKFHQTTLFHYKIQRIIYL